MPSQAVGHARAVWQAGRRFLPKDAGALEVSAFVDSAGKLEIESVARAILLGCQTSSDSSWLWFTEKRLRAWFRAAHVPWGWRTYAFEYQMIMTVYRRRSRRRMYAVTKHFVVFWISHLRVSDDLKQRG